ncbi:MAG: hypothetical protein QXU47_07400 [Candidatus Bathyarchaeia archaeon]
MVKCPACGREFEADPLKPWRFRLYQVRRYQCSLCDVKFNSYDGRKSKFAILLTRSGSKYQSLLRMPSEKCLETL